MMGGLALLLLLGTLYPIEAAEVQQVSLMEAELGGNVTFQCPVSEKEKNILYWYKQPLGCTIQTVATRFFTKQTFRPQFNNSRFRVTQDSLTIMNISKEDEATYFCFTGSQFSHRFVDGTFLAVKDGSLQKSFHVEQSPEAESVLPGDSVTLQCSLVSRDKEDGVQCPHGHRVFWFRSGGSHPGLMYTQDTQPGNTSCVYRLAKRIRNSSDVGTYRCAVASCGQILFGGGTKVDTNGFWSFGDVFLGSVVVLSLNVAAVLIYVIKTNKCDYCNNEAAASLLENVPKGNFKRNEDAWTYSTAVFTVMKSGGRRRAEGAQRENIHAAAKASGSD
uniref:Ig-like domain-containing protein n=1 Tax=Gasterosteus aculeatus aculeatus TaxID=481459 RepID=A0AAQ4PS52_GASAC